MHAADIWYGQSVGARLTRLALTPLSWLYAAGWEGYLACYRLGLKKSRQPHAPVLVVGNLVAGGTGKTPVVVHLATVLQDLGFAVAVGASGYGSPASEGASWAPEGPLDPARWGDEPALLRTLLPNVPLVVGRARVRAAELVRADRPDHFLLMDDGFQHLPLANHLSLVLDDASPANARCLPAGPYREPRRNRRRADLVLPGPFRVESRLTGFEENGSPVDAPGQAHALCAIGRPDRFFADLEAFGVALATRNAKPDHDRLQTGTLFESLDPALPVIVTAKDWVKLRTRPDAAARRILVARHEARIEPQDDFRRWLGARMDAFRTKEP